MLTFIFSVGTVPQKRTRTKVNELDLVALQVNQNILVLHVPMDYALRQTVLDGLQDLLEEVARRSLADSALLGDVVKQVYVLVGTLHNDVELVLLFEEVEQFNDIVLLEIVQEGYLFGHQLIPNLVGRREI